MARSMRLLRKRDRRIVAEDCLVASNMLSRMVGLLGRSALPSGQGIWLEPCSSVHTLFMRFAIDVVFIGNDRKVRKIIKAMVPWRLSAIDFRARSVVELPAGCVDQVGLQVGDELELESTPEVRNP